MQCKKLLDTPFPFPYAQMVLVVLFLFAVLLPIQMCIIINSTPIACIIVTCTTWVFFGGLSLSLTALTRHIHLIHLRMIATTASLLSIRGFARLPISVDRSLDLSATGLARTVSTVHVCPIP